MILPLPACRGGGLNLPLTDTALDPEQLWPRLRCDLAFLWVDKAELSEEAWKVCLPVQTDREVFDALKEYDDVWMYGGESGLPVYAFVVDPWIYVEDFDQYMLLLQGLIAPGMSGGGAFTEDGVFVGILCGGDEEGKVAVVPYSMIETEKP